MLQGIKDILTTMGKALTFADIGETLNEEQKTKVLARYRVSCPRVSETVTPRVILAEDKILA